MPESWLDHTQGITPTVHTYKHCTAAFFDFSLFSWGFLNLIYCGLGNYGQTNPGIVNRGIGPTDQNSRRMKQYVHAVSTLPGPEVSPYSSMLAGPISRFPAPRQLFTVYYSAAARRCNTQISAFKKVPTHGVWCMGGGEDYQIYQILQLADCRTHNRNTDVQPLCIFVLFPASNCPHNFTIQ